MSTISETNNSVQVNAAPLTTGISAANSPILTNDVDNRIVKIRPMSTPIDQLSRSGDVRHVGSMKVNYYTSDVKAVSTTTTKDVAFSDLVPDDTEQTGGMLTLTVEDAAIFSRTETVLLPDLVEDDETPLTLYITDIDTTAKTLKGWVINKVRNFNRVLAGSAGKKLKVVRMGRAAGELDVQTPQYETLPKQRDNFCQIFKMQVEESTLHRLSNKETQWGFSDQEEVAIIDMRQGMEKNFLFGNKAKFTSSLTGDDIYLTQGIWNQVTSPTVRLDFDKFDEAHLIELCRLAFTAGKGGGRKILMGGSMFIAKLSEIETKRVVVGNASLVRWGLEFREIKSNFGTLYVIHNEVFDQCGHDWDAMVIDPNLLTKYVHVPMHTEKLDLRSAGTRNTDAVVITEASCLVLRNPDCHLRVTFLPQKTNS